MTGYERQKVIGRNCKFLQGPDTDVNTIQKISISLKHRCNVSVILKNYQKNKTAFWIEFHVFPMFDKDGALIFFIAFQNDVTDGELLEESIKSARVRQEELIDASGDFFWEFNPRGNFTYLSKRVGDSLGYKGAEMHGKPLFDFLSKEELEEQSLMIQEILVGQRTF